MPPLAVELRNIHKSFPGITANNNVSLGVKPGEIHAIIGENGAGKTTLMNILYGLHKPDRGQILVNGRIVSFSTPIDSIKCGIGMVHQHFLHINNFTVIENIILGMEQTAGPFINIASSRNSVKKICDEYGFDIDLDNKISDISIGMSQKVEILKVLYRKAKTVIMDEPTAVLTPQETDELFEIIKALKETGHTIIFISHKLREIIRIADRVTVMKRGSVMGVRNIEDTNQIELSEMMVGKSFNMRVNTQRSSPGKTLVELKDAGYRSRDGSDILKCISFKLREGEILGVAGVEGNGQQELIEIIWGLRKISSGTIEYAEKSTVGSDTVKVRSERISNIPADRQKYGIIHDISVGFNMILGRQNIKKFSTPLWLRFKNIYKNAVDLISEYNIHPPDPLIRASALSGGNQQKLVVARELSKDPDIILASNPARGVDIGVTDTIYRRFLEHKSRQKGILLISYDMNELLDLSDRIIVLYNGRITGELDSSNADEKKIGLLMTGYNCEN
ncbi:ABC transporter ATP-binding protein [Elusimicrobiota bacterium]